MRNFLSGNGQDTSHKVKKGIDIIENGIDPFCMYVYPFSDSLTEHTRLYENETLRLLFRHGKVIGQQIL